MSDINTTLVTEIKSQLEGLRADWLKSGNEMSDKVGKEIGELTSRLIEVERRSAAVATAESKSIGNRVIDSANFKNLVSKSSKTENFDIKSLVERKALTSATSYVPTAYVGAFTTPFQSTPIRALLPNVPLTEGTFTFARGTFTNNAAVQGAGTSPAVTENVNKAESDLSFSLVNGTISTIAHFIAASKQSLADYMQMASIIDNQLMSGLRVKEENQILKGTGTGGNMLGLIPQATAYDTGLNVSGDNILDRVRRGLYQVQAANYAPSFVVLNPLDWAKVETLKATSNGNYMIGNPAGMTAPMLWGMPVAVSLTMTAGNFLVGAGTEATIYDREDASVQISYDHSDFFIKNMVAVLAEERLGLAVVHPAAFVTGSLT